MSDDVRAFFGETSEPLSAPQPNPHPRPETRTLDEWREVRIADGICPLPGCSGTLDEDFFCALCGNVSLPGQPVAVEGDDGWLPVFPLALRLDEFAPAVVDEPEAA